MSNYKWVTRLSENEKAWEAPIILEHDYEYHLAAEQKLDQLCDELVRVKAPETVIHAAKAIAKGLKAALTKYFEDDIVTAQRETLKVIRKVSLMPFAVSNIRNSFSFKEIDRLLFIPEKNDNYLEKDPEFFRARISSKREQYSQEDMLHIRFTNRDIVKPQRFSVPGFPCYYLATSSYGCWIEMDKPEDIQFYVSPVILDNSLRILNLGITNRELFCVARDIEEIVTDRDHPRKPIQDDFNEIFLSLVILRMLAIVTSYQVNRDDEKVPFRSEYVLSQMIMTAAKDLQLDGIAFLSKKIFPDDDAFPACVNLALFPKYNGEKKLSSICEKISISAPANYAEFKQIIPNDMDTRSELFIDSFDMDYVKIAGRYQHYGETYFHLFDRFLLRLLKDPVDLHKSNIDS